MESYRPLKPTGFVCHYNAELTLLSLEILQAVLLCQGISQLTVRWPHCQLYFSFEPIWPQCTAMTVRSPTSKSWETPAFRLTCIHYKSKLYMENCMSCTSDTKTYASKQYISRERPPWVITLGGGIKKRYR